VRLSKLVTKLGT